MGSELIRELNLRANADSSPGIACAALLLSSGIEGSASNEGNSMNKIYFAGVLALLSGVAACSEQPNANREATSAPAEQSATASTEAVYSATGEVTAVTGETVTISHGPVPDLQWPAMTMEFRAPSPDMLAGVAAGNQVSFAFRQTDGGYVLTSLTKN